MDPADYRQVNLDLWESRVEHHLKSDFYDVAAFKAGASSLNAIELALLPEIRGKDILHLQCHFGQDTLSLARMGARVTGVDFSPKAIAAARELAGELGLGANFICADAYEAAQVIPAPVDMVFTTYGVLGWLPDMRRWAQVVADCLRPGGELVLVEFHPAVWMYDNDFNRPTYSYFNREAIIELEEGTYADSAAPIRQNSIGWNHSIGEVFSALRAAGMQITHLEEYDYSPYDAFNKSVQTAARHWQIAGIEGLMPMVYSLKAFKE